MEVAGERAAAQVSVATATIGGPFNEHYPARPESVTAARRAVTAWFEVQRISPVRLPDLLLAITELATNGAFTCTIPRLPLAPGHYTLSVFCEIDGKIADWVQHAAVLEVAEGDFFGSGHLPSEAHGTFYVDHRWSSEPATVTSLRLRQNAL